MKAKRSPHKGKSAHATAQPSTILSFKVVLGSEIYDKLKGRTDSEIVKALKSYAAKSEGVVRDVFLLMANYHPLFPLVPLRRLPDDNFANATGGFSGFAQACGGCTPNPPPKSPKISGQPVFDSKGNQVACYSCTL